MEDSKFLKDGGYASRKFWLCIIAFGVILLSAKILAAPVIDPVIMGIVTLYTIYAGANTTFKWKGAALLKDVKESQEPKEEAAKEPVKESTKKPADKPLPQDQEGD